MKKEHRRVIDIICIAICLIALVGFAVNCVKRWEQQKQQDVQEEVQDEQEEETPIVIETAEEPEEEVEIPVDFAALKAQNEDVYAWIDIEDTNIHYPILQSATDDSYYLEHTIDHVEGLPGSIYTEKVNAKDFSDFNTLIYGHDMKDGSMFKHLHKFRESEFFNTHETVMIYTETQVKEYRIYAAVIYDNRHIMYAYDNDDVEDRKAFIQSLYDVAGAGSLYREGMEIDENSKLITMSTCITGQSDKRLIVVAEEIE